MQLATAGMIDIVFLLLIFFLVNSSFKPTERQIETALTDPQATSSVSEEDPLVIEVLVGSDQSIRYQVGGQQFSDRQQVREWLEGWPMKSQSLLVKTPAICPVEIPIHLLNDCRKSGFTSVAYLPVVQSQ